MDPEIPFSWMKIEKKRINRVCSKCGFYGDSIYFSLDKSVCEFCKNKPVHIAPMSSKESRRNPVSFMDCNPRRIILRLNDESKKMLPEELCKYLTMKNTVVTLSKEKGIPFMILEVYSFRGEFVDD